jgi:pSer/pThr/pTyr-binding forkhead associated (FHA) protein
MIFNKIIMINKINYNDVKALLLMLLLPLFASAQTLVGDFDTRSYPETSFVWNEYNPELLDSNHFILSNGEQKIAFQLQPLAYADSVKKEKSVLFLWEDLNHADRKGQAEFTRKFLTGFLQDSALQAGDRFNIAVFDRKGGNDAGSSIHTLLSDKFLQPNVLLEKLQNFTSKYDFFSNQKNSEIYLALDEGLEILKREPADRQRIILIVTAGSNQGQYGGKGDFDAQKAVDLKIPVYLVKFPIPHCEHCSNINTISANTFGQQIETANAEMAKNLFAECYRKMNERLAGHDYKITFTFDFPRDGKTHALTWNVNGKAYPLTFTAPAFSLKQWAKSHLWQSIAILAALLILTALIALLIIRQVKKRQQKLQEIEIRQQAAQAQSEANRKALDDFKEQVEEEKINNKKEDFLKLMQIKNLLPRLQYRTDGACPVSTFTIAKPETTIGREDSDLVLINDSVSRRHAKIVFNGSAFEIQDLGSTNRVIVNGAFVERGLLRSGDIIGLGEVVIYFYE